MAQGFGLHRQVLHTWPMHDRLEIEHQLVIRSEDVATTMSLLALEPGQTVGDIGCGSGFYTFRMADSVGPSGTVWAIDIQPAAVDFLKARLQQPGYAGYSNVKVHLSQVDASGIPDGVLDAALLSHADFYAFSPMLPENERMLADILRALRPGGILAVIQDLDIVQRSTQELISGNFIAAGFEQALVIDLPTDNDAYLRFRKPEGPSASSSSAP